MKSNQLRKKLYGCKWTNDVQFIINHQSVYCLYPMTTTTTTKDLVLNLVKSDILFDAQDLINYLRLDDKNHRVGFKYNNTTYYKIDIVVENDLNQVLVILGGK